MSEQEIHHLFVVVDGKTVVDGQVLHCEINKDMGWERHQMSGLFGGRRGTYLVSHPTISLQAELPGENRFLEGEPW